MDEAMETILKVLAEKISSLELSIWLRDNQIAELKKELAEAKGGENDG